MILRYVTQFVGLLMNYQTVDAYHVDVGSHTPISVFKSADIRIVVWHVLDFIQRSTNMCYIMVIEISLKPLSYIPYNDHICFHTWGMNIHESQLF